MFIKIIIFLKFIEFYANSQEINTKCITTFGQFGRCQPIKNCFLSDVQKNYFKIFDYLCVLNKTSFGVCCPASADAKIVNKNPQFNEDFYHRQDLVQNRGCGISTRQYSAGDKKESDGGEWPWLAAIFRTGFPNVYCGGTLITEREVLTAAHCFQSQQFNEFLVRLGEYDIQIPDETRSRDFLISDAIAHKDYDSVTLENDIGIMRLVRPVIFNSYIWPICMPHTDEKWEGLTGYVMGWGSKFFGGPYSRTLLEVSLPIWEHKKCRETYIEPIPSTAICAGSFEGGRDTCQGDSGGPLLVQLPNKRWVVAGVVSWGLRCGEGTHPGVYTRVDKYLPWISENINV